MIPTLDEFRKEIKTKFNTMACFYRWVAEDKFAEIWNALSDELKLELINYFAWYNREAISKFLQKHEVKNLGELSLEALRAEAKKRGMVGYMQLSKSTLLSEMARLEGLNYD